MAKARRQSNVFDAMGSYWAEIANQLATNRQVEFLRNVLEPEGLILDLACGTGRHLIGLSQKGYNIVGLDSSIKLLKITKNAYRRSQLVRADMRFLPFKAKTFRAAFSMDTSFGYLFTEQDDLQSLIDLNYSLTLEGKLTLDVFNQENLLRKYENGGRKSLEWLFLPILVKLCNTFSRWLLFRLFSWKEYPSFLLLQKRTVSTGRDYLTDLWIVYDKATRKIISFKHVVQLHKLAKLKALLERADFLVNQIYGDYERQRFSSASNRLILVASACKSISS